MLSPCIIYNLYRYFVTDIGLGRSGYCSSKHSCNEANDAHRYQHVQPLESIRAIFHNFFGKYIVAIGCFALAARYFVRTFEFRVVFGAATFD
jgi:hypothetical protein